MTHFLYLLLCLIWGTTWLSMKVGLDDLPPRAINVPNRIDTKFNLGSMNKMFTGMAIAKLAERGKLSFEDRIIDHIPDYPNQEIAGNVTIHQLLTHTSGMGN